MTVKRLCRRCGLEVQGELRRFFYSNGQEVLRVYCPNRRNGFEHYAAQVRRSSAAYLLYGRCGIEDLPVHSAEPNKEQCEVIGCESYWTEEHHWAPREMFDEASSWPTSFLCKSHHALWHRTINEPRELRGEHRRLELEEDQARRLLGHFVGHAAAVTGKPLSECSEDFIYERLEWLQGEAERFAERYGMTIEEAEDIAFGLCVLWQKSYGRSFRELCEKLERSG